VACPVSTEHTNSVTGTSIRTPTTLASAAPKSAPKKAMRGRDRKLKQLLASQNI
jgi:hypothetical protein